MTAVPGLTRAPWSALTSLTLSNCGLNSSVIQELAARDWPMLHHLSVSNNKLSTAAVKAMAGSNWPGLRHLDLSSNKLNASAVSQLTQLSWPRVINLDLDDNPDMDSNVVRKLSSGAWPVLKSFTISGSFGLKFFVQVAASPWPLLEMVHVDCNYSAPQAINFAGCWLNLKDLKLITRYPSRFGSFSMPAVAGLTQADWPSLQTLDLSCSEQWHHAAYPWTMASA